MAQPYEFTEEVVLTHAPHTVAVKRNWSDDWNELPYLFCDWFAKTASPDVSRGQFTWRHGVGMRQEETEFAQVDPLDLEFQYVRVEVERSNAAALPPPPDDKIRWYGIFLEDQGDRGGDLAGDQTQFAPSGVQRWLAFGLEYLLVRKIVETSVIDASLAANYGIEPPRPVEIRRALAPNAGSGRSNQVGKGIVGNRSEAVDQDFGAHTFANQRPAYVWNGGDYLRYLIAAHQPVPGGTPRFFESADSQTEAIDWNTPQFSPQGRTVKRVLDALVDRRRLAGWTVDVEPDSNGEDNPAIRVFSFNSEPIEFQDSEGNPLLTIPASNRMRTLDAGDERIVQQSTFRRSSAQKYHQVTVIGSPRTATFSISSADENLFSDWLPAYEDQWLNALNDDGASILPGTSTDDDKAIRNAHRSRDKFREVFRKLQIDATWDGTAADGVAGEAGGQLYAVSPRQTLPDDFLPTIVTDDVDYLWRNGLRFDGLLRLRESVQYDGDKVAEGTANNSGGGDFQRPFAAVRLKEGDSTSTPAVPAIWRKAENIAGDSSDADVSALVRSLVPSSLRSYPDEPAVDLFCAKQQQFAGEAFNTGASGRTPAETDEELAELDWSQGVILTVSMELDSWLRQSYPESVTVPSQSGQDPFNPDATPIETETDWKNELFIFAPEYRLDYLLPSTVVDVGDGGDLARTNEGGYVQDDRQRASDLARIAFEWYGKERRALSLVVNDLDGQFEVGDLITTLGDENKGTLVEVNAIISEVRYNVEEGFTTLRTDYAQLDARALL